MKDIEIAQFKQELQEFLKFMQNAVEEDSEYEGEADELIAAVQRIQVAFKDVHTTNDLKEDELKKIGPDMALYLQAINELSDEDEEWDEDEDEDDEEWDDEDEDEDDEEWDEDEEEWEDDEDEDEDK